MTRYSDLQLDALRELANIGSGNAATALSGLLGRPINGRTAQDTVELAEIILEQAEVAVVPGEAFGTPGYVRMSYALGDEDLAEGVSRMQRLLTAAG